MRLYAALGRFISPMMIVLFRIHTRITGVERSRVAVMNEYGEVLLVKSWVGVQTWELPGGAVERRESPHIAAKRELFEETGIDAPAQDFLFDGTFSGDYTAHIYSLITQKDAVVLRPRGRHEITAIAWFHPSKLPTDIAPHVRHALNIVSK